jgi:hypothetical protein
MEFGDTAKRKVVNTHVFTSKYKESPMLALIKELTDRFIEFILSLVKGETLEAQLTSALKSSIFLITALSCLLINELITNMNQRMELKDMGDGIAKVNVLFDSTNGGSIQGFLKINSLLAEQNIQLKRENIVFLSHGIALGSENQGLKLQLLQVLGEDKRLMDNNKVLLTLCWKTGKKALQ